MTSLVPAPEGYIVDFDNPQRQGNVATYCCFGVGMFLAMLFTAQRLYVQLGLGRNWQIDDSESPNYAVCPDPHFPFFPSIFTP